MANRNRKGNGKRIAACVLSGAMVLSGATIPEVNQIAVNAQTVDAQDKAVQTVGQKLETGYVSEDFEYTNEELFEMYAAQTLGLIPESSSYSLNYAGAHLTGQDKIIYDELKEQIKKVADGDNSSAVFDIPYSKILNNKLTYTKGDLDGVDLSNSTAVSNKIFNYDINKVMKALLCDCPYELYWNDKTQASSIQCSGYSYNSNSIYFENDAKMTWMFVVDKSFRSNEEELNSVDISKTRAAKNVAENAQAIVNEAAGKTDYEKLVYYKDKICELNTYNNEAATGGSSQLGISPWQIIYVFDKDPNTNVVCEGYAKAFAYLCELTKFSSPIRAYTVTGTMEGGTGAGPHMWNVVQMENGKNYLVDVTNCDSGTVGAPNYLFLQGYDEKIMDGSNVIGYKINIPERPAEQEGYKHNAVTISFTYDATTLSTYDWEELELSAKDYGYACSGNHNYEGVDYISNNDATCATQGTKSRTCIDCGYVDTVLDDNQPATGLHDYLKGETNDKSKEECSACNVKNIAYTGLDSNFNIGTKYYTGSEIDPIAFISGLTKDTDYTISDGYMHTDAGEYTFTVTGKGDYAGTRTVSWKIANFDEDDAKVIPQSWYTTTAVTLNAPSGYTICGSKDGTYSATYSPSGLQEGSNTVTYYLKKNEGGYISAANTVTIKVDTTVPTVNVTSDVSDTAAKLTVSASDGSGSGVKEYYLLSTTDSIDGKTKSEISVSGNKVNPVEGKINLSGLNPFTTYRSRWLQSNKKESSCS